MISQLFVLRCVDAGSEKDREQQNRDNNRRGNGDQPPSAREVEGQPPGCLLARAGPGQRSSAGCWWRADLQLSTAAGMVADLSMNEPFLMLIESDLSRSFPADNLSSMRKRVKIRQPGQSRLHVLQVLSGKWGID